MKTVVLIASLCVLTPILTILLRLFLIKLYAYIIWNCSRNSKLREFTIQLFSRTELGIDYFILSGLFIMYLILVIFQYLTGG